MSALSVLSLVWIQSPFSKLYMFLVWTTPIFRIVECGFALLHNGIVVLPRTSYIPLTEPIVLQTYTGSWKCLSLPYFHQTLPEWTREIKYANMISSWICYVKASWIIHVVSTTQQMKKEKFPWVKSASYSVHLFLLPPVLWGLIYWLQSSELFYRKHLYLWMIGTNPNIICEVNVIKWRRTERKNEGDK